MKRIHFLLAFCALLVGCSVNEPIKIDSDIFCASMESFGNDTRTSLTAGLDVAWSEGDHLTIFRGNHLGDKYQILSEYAGKPYGDFELVEESSIGDNFSSGTELPANVAIYPYSENLAITKNIEGDSYSYTISGVEFPAQQNYVKNSFAEESFIMAAVTESLSDHKLKFKNVGGAIKLQLKGTGTIKAISIKGNNNEDLAGIADITVSAETIPTFVFASSAKEITLDCGTNGVELNSDEITNFIISLPVVNFTKGFTVTIIDIDNNIHMIDANSVNTVIRSSLLIMPSVTLNIDQPGYSEGDFESNDIVGWWEWDMSPNTGIRFMSDGGACFWDEDGTYDTFGWWLEGDVLCTREWAPGDSGTPSDDLCSWAGNPQCNCNKEGGRHITKIIKLTDTELIVNIDDDNAYDSDYDMPFYIKFTKVKGIQ